LQVYCPSCEDIYSTKSRLDGAFFTASLPHLLMLQYPDIKPPKPTDRYVPRIYGYRIHKPAHAHAAKPPAPSVE
jgi:casein kinase II subunit beta